MAFPPYLITMVVPAKRWIQGSASISVPALSWASDVEVVSRVWVFMLFVLLVVLLSLRSGDQLE
jgi:hypothetical protein